MLNRVAMFRPLPMPAIDNLAVQADHAQVPAGQDVFHHGDHGDRSYVIADGARTPLRLYTLEPSHVLSVVNGYQTSAREAES